MNSKYKTIYVISKIVCCTIDVTPEQLVVSLVAWWFLWLVGWLHVGLFACLLVGCLLVCLFDLVCLLV